MIRILYRSENGIVNTGLQVSDLCQTLGDPGGLLWFDLANEPLEVIEPILASTFEFHPLAIDDALVESHVPKVDNWGHYLYIVLRAISYKQGAQLRIPELDVFLGSNYLVTYSQEPIAALNAVWDVCQKDHRWIEHGAGQLLYRLADELVSDAVAVVEKMQDELEKTEDQLFSEARPATLERLFTSKRNILQIRRIVVPQRDVLNKLARNENQIVREQDRIFFRDVYDHLLQLDNLLGDMIILVSGALDAYLSVVNNRMNDIMKTLTVITAFFMPLAFITGFFGMNFFQAVSPLRAWTGIVAFIAVIAAMALIPLIMFLWMRWRSWI